MSSKQNYKLLPNPRGPMCLVCVQVCGTMQGDQVCFPISQPALGSERPHMSPTLSTGGPGFSPIHSTFHISKLFRLNGKLRSIPPTSPHIHFFKIVPINTSTYVAFIGWWFFFFLSFFLYFFCILSLLRQTSPSPTNTDTPHRHTHTSAWEGAIYCTSVNSLSSLIPITYACVCWEPRAGVPALHRPACFRAPHRSPGYGPVRTGQLDN